MGYSRCKRHVPHQNCDVSIQLMAGKRGRRALLRDVLSALIERVRVTVIFPTTVNFVARGRPISRLALLAC